MQILLIDSDILSSPAPLAPARGAAFNLRSDSLLKSFVWVNCRRYLRTVQKLFLPKKPTKTVFTRITMSSSSDQFSM
jgi:hypothetical protein